MNKPILPKTTRRTFVKTMAATAALAAMATEFEPEPFRALAAGANPPAVGKVTQSGFCMGCHFAKCSTLYDIENGVVTRVRGNPAGPWNEGMLCVRGNAALMTLYSPYRIKTPLKRTNPQKGLDVDPGWVEISWEEALSTVAGKLKEIRAGDRRRLIVFSGFGSDLSYLKRLFPIAFGTPNAPSATGAMCTNHWASQIINGSFMTMFDEQYNRYGIALGFTVGPNLAGSDGATDKYWDAVDEGARIIKVDPRASAENRMGEWVPIRPGTDLAFVLAMANVIIHEIKVMDTWFLKNRTNLVYLIGADGFYVRDAESKKPLVWDAADNKAKTFDDATIKDYALEGEYAVGGVAVQPAFALLKEQIKKNTPEWAAEITTIPAQTIRRITRELVQAAQIGSTIVIDGVTMPLRPAGLAIMRGLTGHRDGHLANLATYIVNALIGAIGVPGGVVGSPGRPTLTPDQDGIVRPVPNKTAFKYPPDNLDASEFVPFAFANGYRMVDTILEPDKYGIKYKPELMLTFGVNVFTKGAAEADRIAEAFRQIPMIVAIAPQMDEHAAFADIVLPESNYLEHASAYSFVAERPRKRQLTTVYAAMQPLIGPQYQSRHIDEILMDLAERAGFLTGKGGLNDLINRGIPPSAPLSPETQMDIEKRYPIKDIHDRVIRTMFGSAGFDDVAKEGGVCRTVKPSQVYPYFFHPANKTRHQIYNVLLKSTGEELLANLKKAGIAHPGWSEEDIRFYYQAIPAWKPTATYNPPAGFDLYPVLWKAPMLIFDVGNATSNPYLQEVSANDPYCGKLLMNTATAAKKGLKDGDLVMVESQFGAKVGPVPVKTTELVHPEVVGVASGLKRQVPGINPAATQGIAYNRLLSTKWETLEIITGAMELSPRVKVTKA